MTNEVFTDKRLLGALDYIDERFIAEVTESYTFEAPGEYKRDKKTVFKAYRQFAALAACLLLLSAAFPVLNYAVQRFGTGIWEGFAGAGSENVEDPDFLNYSSDMSVDEVLADVIEKGYVVISNGECISGRGKWDDFLKSIENGDPATVKMATHYSLDLVSSGNYGQHINTEDYPQIFLGMLSYNGESYNYVYDAQYGDDWVFEYEYKYLLSEPYDLTEDGLGAGIQYYVSQDASYSSGSLPAVPAKLKECGHSIFDDCICTHIVLWLPN